MSEHNMRRRVLARGAAAMAALALFGGPAVAADFPSRQIELIVPFQPGGGTDGVARAFAEAARTHIPRSIVVLNKPGASGAIGWTEMINAKPDGYKLAVVTVELVTLKPMGLAKFNQDDIQPIIQFNADPAAITVHADAPWNTLQEFWPTPGRRRARCRWAMPATARSGTSRRRRLGKRPASSSTISRSRAPARPCRPCWASTWTRWPSARPRWRNTCSPAN